MSGKGVMLALLIVLAGILVCLRERSSCTSLCQEKVFKFHEMYGNYTGYSIRSNKMKKYVVEGNMDSFYKTHGEIYEQFEFFDKKFNNIPYYHNGLILLQEMI